MSKYVKMKSVACYLPGEPIRFDNINNYLGDFPLSDKLDLWTKRVQPIMEEILGFKYCYYAFDNKTRTFTDDNLTMAVKASRIALERANMKASDIDLIIYGGACSNQMPPLSTRIQEELGIECCGELYIHSNCTSVYKAIEVADMMLKQGEYKNALVVTSNTASSGFIPEFYNQKKMTKDDIFLRWYLCDGAGAMILTGCDEKKEGFFLDNTYMESAGGNKKAAMYNSYKYRWNNPKDDFAEGLHHIRQIYISDMKEFVLDSNGKTTFYNGVRRMLEKKQLNLEKIKYFVVNMPSKFVREYIIDECVELGIPKDKFFSAIENVGYAGPPAALISIDNLLSNTKFEDGDVIYSFVMEVSKFLQAGFTLEYVK